MNSRRSIYYSLTQLLNHITPEFVLEIHVAAPPTQARPICS